MSALNNFWITDKHLDFESKKHLLLSYLKDVEKEFLLNKLFPPFIELKNHYKQLMSFRTMKASLHSQFPKELVDVNLEKIALNYNDIFEESSMIKELDKIINFSIPKLEMYIKEGRKIYDFFKQQIEISPVGIVPLCKTEGYLFLQDNSKNKTKVYEYEITLYEDSQVEYKRIKTNYLSWYSNSVSNTSEAIKSRLIKYRNKLSNPAIYLAKTSIAIPEDETFLPIAKRALVKLISKDTGC